MKVPINSWIDALANKKAVLRYFETIASSGELARVEAELERVVQRRDRIIRDINRAGEQVQRLTAEIAHLEATLSPKTLELIQHLLKLAEQQSKLLGKLTPDDVERIESWLAENETSSPTGS